MMKGLIPILIVFSSALAHQTSQPPELPVRMWAPPNIALPSVSPPPTVPKTIVTRIRVAGSPITLGHTVLRNVAKQLGVVPGHRGDAGESIDWLCFYGKDAAGPWGLWLISGEIDGPTIGSFQWQHLSTNTRMDRRCKLLDTSDKPSIDLPIALHLGMSEQQVETLVGKPSSKYHGTSIYVHEHSLKLHGEPYVADNSLYLTYWGGVLWTVFVNYTISS